MDVQATVVLEEAEFPELVHKEIHARPCRSDHFGEHFLRNSWQYLTPRSDSWSRLPAQRSTCCNEIAYVVAGSRIRWHI